ncbi:MAG: prenyltransferase/squalene oxidase repeat-containing protein, partial [bacterium]
MKIKKIILAIAISSLSFAQSIAMENGLSWLYANQNQDGSWGKNMDILERDTTEVLDTLHYFNKIGPEYSKGLLWLANRNSLPTDYLARKIKTFSNGGMDVSLDLTTLISYQNDDGGWSGYDFKDAESFVLDTILSLSALKSANYTNNSVIEPALLWLIANQKEDGGFGFDESNVYLTSLAILTLNQYKDQFYLTPNIEKARNWLILQNPETLWEKALMYQATMRKDLLEDILNAQLDNGSWDNDPFTTALCLRAIKDAAPDLIVSEILFDPQVPLEGETTTITA